MKSFTVGSVVIVKGEGRRAVVKTGPHPFGGGRFMQLIEVEGLLPTPCANGEPTHEKWFCCDIENMERAQRKCSRLWVPASGVAGMAVERF